MKLIDVYKRQAYDAIKAGFDKIVFIIKKEMEKDFKELIGDKIARKVEVEYVFQDIDSVLPSGFHIPEGRSKPWGTGHALLCCKDVLHEPFAIINADDFYGRESYKILHDYLADPNHTDYCLIGYILENTLTDNGSVTRGICQSENGLLTEVKAVSYTHLDVYKRQPLDYAAFMKNPTQLDIGVYNMDTNEVEYFGKEYFDPIEQRLMKASCSLFLLTRPVKFRNHTYMDAGSVSYTHLDVYKRQSYDRPQCCK